MLRKAFATVRFSSVYRSEPLELEEQDAFLNAVAMFETKLTPEQVLKKLQAIEKKLKKKPPVRFGPRTIDLDLLLHGDEIRLEDELTIPHLRLHARRFVLEPLLELGAGDLVHPGFDRKLRSYWKEVEGQECRKIDFSL